MDNKIIRTLIIEDEPSISKIVKEFLARAEGVRFEVECLEQLKPALERLNRGNIDVILLDLNLPDSLGYDTFTKVKQCAANIPIIILTGIDDNSLATKAVQEGAQDYLVKGQLDAKALPRTITFAIERSRLSKK